MASEACTVLAQNALVKKDLVTISVVGSLDSYGW